MGWGSGPSLAIYIDQTVSLLFICELYVVLSHYKYLSCFFSRYFEKVKYNEFLELRWWKTLKIIKRCINEKKNRGENYIYKKLHLCICIGNLKIENMYVYKLKTKLYNLKN